MLNQVAGTGRQALCTTPPLSRPDFSIMFADARQGGRDSVYQNNNGTHHHHHHHHHHPWPHKVPGFPRELRRADSEHKMTCDKNGSLRFVAKEHTAKSHESTGSSGDLSNRPWRQTKLPFAARDGREQPDVAGYSCAPEASPVRWNRSVGQEQKHCLFVRDYYRECRFVEHCHQTDTHPSSRKCSPAPPTQFKGQENCGAPVYSQGQQRGCVREPFQREPYGADMPDTGKQDPAPHDYLKNTLNSDSDCKVDSSKGDQVAPKVLAQESLDKSSSSNSPILPYKVSRGELASANKQQQQHQQSHSQMGEITTNAERLPSSAAQGPKPAPEPEPQPEPCLPWPKKKQRAVRDQIQRVVVELEGILHGLKEVHLEMKEVVQQIELLTSDIDLTGDEPHAGLHSDTLGSSSSSGVMVGCLRAEGDDSGDVESSRADSVPSSQKSVASESSSPVSSSTVANARTQHTPNSNEDHNTSPNYPLNTDSPPAIQSSGPRPKGRREGMKPALLRAVTLGARGKKPPPYPHQHPKTTRADKGRDCPPYPVKRRLLSTTV
ncbi:uncharacterized protein LOC143117170 [Alosa pseudoharengus]|uniref:uncharacterized protein LOC143117170 n=1 Tax=Alosa pseudoharengus TaxID=34774 RepID=UPI003F8929F7